MVVPSWAAIRAVAEEIDERWLAAPAFLAGTGVRLEEWLALERKDVNALGRSLAVRRVFSGGELAELGADGKKTGRQRRNVPLRRIALDALELHQPRLDTPILFPAPRGGYMDLERFTSRVWSPAIIAAGVEPFPAV